MRNVCVIIIQSQTTDKVITTLKGKIMPTGPKYGEIPPICPASTRASGIILGTKSEPGGKVIQLLFHF